MNHPETTNSAPSEPDPTGTGSARPGETRAEDRGEDYDVVLIGGGFSGASLALLLRRWLPSARVLVVETRGEEQRKIGEVGEATVEVSGCFLHRVLGLYQHLAESHLPKHGLRYWFSASPSSSLAEMSEVGPREVPRLPTFQIDRAVLDEHLLELAVGEGTGVARPCRVVDVDLGWPQSRLTLEENGKERTVTARWVVDASGRRTFLSRRLGLYQRTEEHPTSAIWARFQGVADMDGPAMLGNDARAPKLQELLAARRLATNHFCGYGWWCWAIPLSGGRTSIGLVYNKELFELPGSGTKGERFQHFVDSQPGLRELAAGAQMEDDLMTYAHLPYRSSQYMDRGWALVGDAASFIDPYYSPGLDHAAISVYATARRIEEDLSGVLDDPALGAAIAHHNQIFQDSYDRWISALYLGKYEIMGDAELTGSAFLFDTAMYYMGVVSPLYRNVETLQNPLFGPSQPQSRIAHRVMQAFTRRLTKLARFRRQVGTYGKRNRDYRVYAKSFGLGRGSLGPLLQGLAIWLRVEIECWGIRLRRGRVDTSSPVPTPTSKLSPEGQLRAEGPAA
ncbi:MAG: NAD(P)/FAD-dependent oxidoreductase [Deltaproteobacteria bacterium]|nr:NAD(P)/FAD-dependent oxidoreductase [Deltaproteobacteria bacterium]